MELRHIRYFLAVAEELNFTKAAERLCIAQPPLSRQIKDLENELGADLFVRKSHGLQLTEEGEHFLSYARQILSLEAKAKEEIRGLDQGLQGLLRLDSVDGQGPFLMAKWLAGFHEKYPLVQFDLWKGNSDEVQQRIHKNLSDIGIVMEPYNGVGFEGVKIYKEPWVAILPADHPLAAIPGDSVSCKELSEYELIIPARDIRRNEIVSWFSKYDCAPKIIGRMAHVANAYQLAANHVGISIYPAAAGALVNSDTVCIKTLQEPGVEASYVLIRSSEKEMSPAAMAFWEFITRAVEAESGRV